MLTPNERARLHARSGCAMDTIKAYPRVREASRLRIERAAAEEGIALVPAVERHDSNPPASAA